MKTIDELHMLYAPVDSPDEALSFALTIGDYSAYYGQTKKINYVYSVEELEDTYVKTTSDGYFVHVFYTPVFGCSPFETQAVDITVTFDGRVNVINSYPVYYDSSRPKECVD